MKAWLELLKLRITVASTITTAVGYVMARGQFDTNMLLAMLGILLQACGAAAMNQVQDSNLDIKMPRTAGRPIPSGRIPRVWAAVYSVALVLLGTAILWTYGMLPALLGVLAAVIYNGIYTPMKRLTPFVVLPGAVIGAIPPVVGWLCAGGYITDPTIHMVAFFFFIWQMPHFWLLLLVYARDYIDGGLPSLFDRFDRRQIVKFTFLWIIAVCVAAMLLPMVNLFDHVVYAYVVAVAAVVVVVRATALLRIDVRSAVEEGGEALKAFNKSCKIRFMEINTFSLLVSVLLVVDGLG
ncbi:MAG: protoheme IX farnesyltransferase [Candidatus Krumholzibacteriia bacterium]